MKTEGVSDLTQKFRQAQQKKNEWYQANIINPKVQRHLVEFEKEKSYQDNFNRNQMQREAAADYNRKLAQMEAQDMIKKQIDEKDKMKQLEKQINQFDRDNFK